MKEKAKGKFGLRDLEPEDLMAVVERELRPLDDGKPTLEIDTVREHAFRHGVTTSFSVMK